MARATMPSQVGGLIDDFILSREALGRERKTMARYRSLAKNNIVPYIGTASVATLRSDRLDRFFAQLRVDELSDTTIAHVYGLLSAAFRWGMRKDRVDRNPTQSVDPPRRSRSAGKALSIDEVVSFIDWLPTSHWARWRPLFLFALATGMRRGEILALRREWIDSTRGIIWVAESVGECDGATYLKRPKTDHPREVALSPLAWGALKDASAVREHDRELLGGAYEDRDLVFADVYGHRIRPMAFTDAFRRAGAAAGLKGVTLHSLRHTTATLMIAGGVDALIAGKVLGHDDPTTTLRIYGHVVAGAQELAVGVVSDVYERAKALLKPQG
ncbi:MAG: tyrosine-type recombinase/integrase [Vulcanimicrobiaceae bacterium]